jgi:hypothetical protein
MKNNTSDLDELVKKLINVTDEIKQKSDTCYNSILNDNPTFKDENWIEFQNRKITLEKGNEEKIKLLKSLSKADPDNIKILEKYSGLEPDKPRSFFNRIKDGLMNLIPWRRK